MYSSGLDLTWQLPKAHPSKPSSYCLSLFLQVINLVYCLKNFDSFYFVVFVKSFETFLNFFFCFLLWVFSRFEGQISGKNIEIGIIGADKKFRCICVPKIYRVCFWPSIFYYINLASSCYCNQYNWVDFWDFGLSRLN